MGGGGQLILCRCLRATDAPPAAADASETAAVPWNRVAAALQDLLAPRAGGEVEEASGGAGAAAAAEGGGGSSGPLRSGKQCRERWVHRLRPGVVTGDWTPEEEDALFELVRGGEMTGDWTPEEEDALFELVRGGERRVLSTCRCSPPRHLPLPAPPHVGASAGAAARDAVVAPRAVHASPQRPQPQEQVGGESSIPCTTRATVQGGGGSGWGNPMPPSLQVLRSHAPLRTVSQQARRCGGALRHLNWPSGSAIKQFQHFVQARGT